MCLKEKGLVSNASTAKGLGTSKSKVKYEKANQINNDKSKENMANHSVYVTEALQCISTNVILPTFTCILHNKRIRTFKDGGSIIFFLKDSVAERHHLKVLKEVKLKVWWF